MTFNDIEIIELVKQFKDKPQEWIKNARVYSKTLKALVNGENFQEELINRIEHIESENRAKARKRYSKDIRDMANRIMSKRENVFESNGTSEIIDIKNDKIKDEVISSLSNFKSNKSIKKYLSENLFQLADTDPNGLMMLEVANEKTYPTYKSIKDIRHYEPKGQLTEFVIFEPIHDTEKDVYIWRVIDDIKDWTIIQKGDVFLIDKDNTIDNVFGEVPAIILSEIEKVGTKERLSYLDKITELMKDYAKDKSVLTIYKFLKGFPLHWKFVSQCRSCGGSGKYEDTSCGTCNGKGYLTKGDVSDVVTLPLPKEGQPNIAPNIAGFIQPDLETWRQLKEDLRDQEDLIEDTIWGTDKLKQNEYNNETATGRFIDTQPINNKLNYYAGIAEYFQNTLANWVVMFKDPLKNQDGKLVYRINYGRRFIIESPDMLIKKYEESKEKGCNVTILDKLLEEYILSKHKSDPKSQSIMLKKAQVEPYVHFSNKEIFDYYGQKEVYKKQQFEEFWQMADKSKDAETLKREFKEFINQNQLTNESM